MGMELDVAQPLILAHGEGETTTDRPDRTLRILCEHEQLIVTWFRYEPGEKGPDPHIHRQHTDAFYVLEGEVDFGLGPEITRITGGPETFAGAPPNVVHTFKNSSDATAIFLNIHAPRMGFGDVLRGGDHEHFDQFDPPEGGGRPSEQAIVQPARAGGPIKRNGKATSGFWKGSMVFKLTDEGNREQALALDGAERFDPMGDRPMHEWVVVPASHSDEWPRLAEDALTL